MRRTTNKITEFFVSIVLILILFSCAGSDNESSLYYGDLIISGIDTSIIKTLFSPEKYTERENIDQAWKYLQWMEDDSGSVNSSRSYAIHLTIKMDSSNNILSIQYVFAYFEPLSDSVSAYSYSVNCDPSNACSGVTIDTDNNILVFNDVILDVGGPSYYLGTAPITLNGELTY